MEALKVLLRTVEVMPAAQCVACGGILQSLRADELERHKTCVVQANHVVHDCSALCGRILLALPFAVAEPAPVPNGRKNHCPKGHEYSEANTYRDPNGWRHCRKCK